MQIVYCIDQMSHPGGIGRVTSIKANWLAKHGHNIWVVTASQCDEMDYYELSPSVKRIDFGIKFQLGIDNNNLLKKAISKVNKMRRYRMELKRFIEDLKPDIVVSTFTNDSDFLYKFKDGSKKVLEFHFCYDGFKSQREYGPQTLKNKLLSYYRLKKHKYIAKKYDTFVVLTQEDATKWNGYINLHVIPNMLSFEPKVISSCIEKRVIAVGRLDFQKKFDRLIDIWSLLYNKCPDWRLTIFGSGPDKDNLLEQIKRLGLTGIVTIHQPTQIIEEEFLKSSLFVMTSTYEGLPMTMLEALSCGLPCVSYDFKCGPKDIIIDGWNGYIVEENDKKTFAERLLELIKDDVKRTSFGRNAKQSSERYKADNIMPIWEELFNELLKQPQLTQGH